MVAVLGPGIGAVVVYLFLRMLVWSKPDARSLASHGLWVGIIGWMASSLQGAMNAGILPGNPTVPAAQATPEQIGTALAWPILACLAIHALGQSSYPAAKGQRRFTERPGWEFLPRRLAWTTTSIFAFTAAVLAWVATLPGHTPVAPSATPPQPQDVDTGYYGQGQDGRIPGWELAAWLGGALLVLASGTLLLLWLIGRRRQLEALDADDDRTLRGIAANRLLRTVATIAAGLATIAGNFAAQPETGSAWQSSWFNALGVVNMAVLLVMLLWPVPRMPSLCTAGKGTSVWAIRAHPGTHGAARLTISIGVALGMLGGLAAVAGFVAMYALTQPQNSWVAPLALGLVAALLLVTIWGGDVLIGRNYGTLEAPVRWPLRPVSRGLSSFALASALLVVASITFVVAIHAGQPFAAATWPAAVTGTLLVAAAGAVAILAARRRRGIPEDDGDTGLDAALRVISMYRIVRTLSAYCLGQSALLLMTSGDAWYQLFVPTPGVYPLAPSPAVTLGMVLAAIAVITAITPARGLIQAIPRPRHATSVMANPPRQSKLDP
ncbi:hypothetical protein [Arthrobacter sp. fls2-241-R2A-172]|uniref:hypothetical protein n=1 Tax=Arthrobacter sp. fls2-241-R2A-172 TaxID=3040325 RepID=UPI0025516150|nr:hypothetical protein [Arthrobacter sp. fls2-241-R2A-172]